MENLSFASYKHPKSLVLFNVMAYMAVNQKKINNKPKTGILNKQQKTIPGNICNGHENSFTDANTYITKLENTKISIKNNYSQDKHPFLCIKWFEDTDDLEEFFVRFIVFVCYFNATKPVCKAIDNIKEIIDKVKSNLKDIVDINNVIRDTEHRNKSQDDALTNFIDSFCESLILKSGGKLRVLYMTTTSKENFCENFKKKLVSLKGIICESDILPEFFKTVFTLISKNKAALSTKTIEKDILDKVLNTELGKNNILCSLLLNEKMLKQKDELIKKIKSATTASDARAVVAKILNIKVPTEKTKLFCFPDEYKNLNQVMYRYIIFKIVSGFDFVETESFKLIYVFLLQLQKRLETIFEPAYHVSEFVLDSELSSNVNLSEQILFNMVNIYDDPIKDFELTLCQWLLRRKGYQFFNENLKKNYLTRENIMRTVTATQRHSNEFILSLFDAENTYASDDIGRFLLNVVYDTRVITYTPDSHERGIQFQNKILKEEQENARKEEEEKKRLDEETIKKNEEERIKQEEKARKEEEEKLKRIELEAKKAEEEKKRIEEQQTAEKEKMALFAQLEKYAKDARNKTEREKKMKEEAEQKKKRNELLRLTLKTCIHNDLITLCYNGKAFDVYNVEITNQKIWKATKFDKTPFAPEADRLHFEQYLLKPHLGITATEFFGVGLTFVDKQKYNYLFLLGPATDEQAVLQHMFMYSILTNLDSFSALDIELLSFVFTPEIVKEVFELFGAFVLADTNPTNHRLHLETSMYCAILTEITNQKNYASVQTLFNSKEKSDSMWVLLDNMFPKDNVELRTKYQILSEKKVSLSALATHHSTYAKNAQTKYHIQTLGKSVQSVNCSRANVMMYLATKAFVVNTGYFFESVSKNENMLECFTHLLINPGHKIEDISGFGGMKTCSMGIFFNNSTPLFNWVNSLPGDDKAKYVSRIEKMCKTGEETSNFVFFCLFPLCEDTIIEREFIINYYAWHKAQSMFITRIKHKSVDSVFYGVFKDFITSIAEITKRIDSDMALNITLKHSKRTDNADLMETIKLFFQPSVFKSLIE